LSGERPATDCAQESTDLLLAVAGFVTLYLAIGALSPYLPVYYESLGLPLDAIGLLAALYAGAAMLGAPAWGSTADRLGPARPVLAIAAALATLASVVLGIADGVLIIAVAAAALALAMSGIMPILDARSLEIAATRNTQYAGIRVWGSGAYIVGVLVTGWIAEQVGIGAMFLVLVPALAATALVGIGIRSRPTVAPLTRLEAVGSVLRDRTLMPFLVVVLLTWTSSTTINAFFSIHLVNLGAAPWIVGAAWAMGAAVEIPLLLGFGRLVRRLGIERLLLIGATLFVLRAIAVAVTRDPLVVTASMALHGGAFALFLVGGVTYVAQRAPPGAAATAQGVLTATVFGLAQILGPGLGGLMAESTGLRFTFLLAAIGGAIALAGLAWVLRPATIAPT
jgi:PPP family 3-phenylpropionic acid transporter